MLPVRFRQALENGVNIKYFFEGLYLFGFTRWGGLGLFCRAEWTGKLLGKFRGDSKTGLMIEPKSSTMWREVKVAKKKQFSYEWNPARGVGSHGTVYLGGRFAIVKDLTKELGPWPTCANSLEFERRIFDVYSQLPCQLLA